MRVAYTGDSTVVRRLKATLMVCFIDLVYPPSTDQLFPAEMFEEEDDPDAAFGEADSIPPYSHTSPRSDYSIGSANSVSQHQNTTPTMYEDPNANVIAQEIAEYSSQQASTFGGNG